jgi:flavin reductase (DIM6/NTAB) family NADH-FMN oxidoreductase RutF
VIKVGSDGPQNGGDGSTAPGTNRDGGDVIAEQAFRDVMATICAPVTVVTVADGEAASGTTVSAFASLSLRPPMITAALDRSSRLLEPVLRAGRFGVNVLGHGQDDTARLFADRSVDRFAAVDWHYDHGLPRLSGAPGWLVCELAQAVDGGDHMLLLGRVLHTEARTAAPLVYGHRAFGTHSGYAARPRRPITDLIAACSR